MVSYIFRNELLKSNKTFQISLLIIAISFSLIIASKLSFLFSPFLWGIVFYFTFRNIYIKYTKNEKRKKILIAILLSLILLIFITIISFFLILILNSKLLPFLLDKELINNTINIFSNNLHKILPEYIDVSSYLFNILPKISNYFLSFITNMGTIILDIVFTIIIFFILIINNNKIIFFLKKILPFNEEGNISSINRFESLVKGNTISIPLVAISQGIVSIIGYYLFGFSIANAFILGFLTAVASIIPIIGITIIYIPAVLYLIIFGHNLFNGIALFLWFFILVASVDNITRAIFQKKISNISPFYTIIGSIIGVQIFGLSGLIFGPIILIITTSLWKLYYNNFGLYKLDKK